MQRYISNIGVPRKVRCDQATMFRAKKCQLFCKSNNIEILFVSIDDHKMNLRGCRASDTNIKAQAGVMRINSFKIASGVAEIKKTLRKTPHKTAKKFHLKPIWDIDLTHQYPT